MGMDVEVKRNSEAGYTLVIAIVMIAIIATLATTVGRSFLTLAVMASRDQAQFDSQNLGFYMRILFKNRDACTAVLLNGDFGTELQKVIANPSAVRGDNITIGFPGPVGSTPTSLIRKDMNHESIRIISSSIFSSSRLPFSGASAYLVTGRVQYTPNSEPNNVYVLDYPVYVTTTSAGALNDCFVTSMNMNKTAEDLLCENYGSGRNSRYSPREGRCASTN